jgi:hypothetical protein
LALTQKGVNGAEFSVDTVQEMRKMAHSALTFINSKDKKGFCEITAYEAFTRQRGKDAKEVRRDAAELMTAVGSGKGTSAQLGNLYAEWRALTERQAGHNFVWKLFHLLENSRRNTLLKDMKAALVVMTSNMALPDDLEPANVAMEYESRNASEIISENFEKFHLNPEQAFGYEQFIDDPTMLEKFNKDRESMKCYLNLISDVSEKNENKDLSSQIMENDPLLKKDDKLLI